METIVLTPLDLSLAATLVLALAASTAALQLGVARSVLVAAARTTIQLALVGLVLKALFESGHFVWMALAAVVMLAVATREVAARQQRRFRGAWGVALGGVSIFVSSFTVTLLALIVAVRPEPLHDPRYAVPLLGMMTGNTMTGIALALNRLTEGARQQRGAIEARLMLGSEPGEAVGNLRRDAMRTGIIPMVNSMAAAGLVSLPGMMTGQILAGNPPTEAVKYQILIMFLIAGGTGFGVLCAISLGCRRLFDARGRLRLERLR